jgi:glycosyltransferase involved in cell wall biosynthesis
MTEPVIVMVGTGLDNKGGIAAVVNVYRELGLFERWPIRYVATHVDGTRVQKLIRACSGALVFTGLLMSRKIALVHVHSASGPSFWRKLYFMLLTLATGRKLVLHVHGGNFDSFAIRQTRPWARALIRFVLRRATRVIALSEHWGRWFADFAPGCRASVIFNPVQLPPPTARETQAVPMLLFLGKMCRDKGNYDLLDAMALVLPRHPDVRLVCAGDGEADVVMAHARKLGIAHAVETPGWVAGAAKSRLFEQAMVFVLPSYFEGMPMSILEAMAYAVPVVATPVGGIPEMLDDKVDGLLVPPGDVDGLARALSALLDDRERARRMGLAGREKVIRQFAATTVVGQVEGVYRELGAVGQGEESISTK